MSRIPLVAALEVIRQLRTDQIVVTTMGAAREWPRISDHPLDFHYIPSAMGQSPSIALGLALAQPQREVIVFTGDGSLLMNLGCLVTLAASGTKNVTLILLDNGVYEVTGGQKTAGQLARADFAGFATAAGIETVATFDDLIDWQRGAAAVLRFPRPALHLAPRRARPRRLLPRSPGPPPPANRSPTSGTAGLVKRRNIYPVLGNSPVRWLPSPRISPEELKAKTWSQIRDLARQKGLIPRGDPIDPDYPRRWLEPVTNVQRLRLDRGHIDPSTGRSYNNPNAAVNHVHGYEPDGTPIEVDFDPHIPTIGD